MKKEKLKKRQKKQDFKSQIKTGLIIFFSVILVVSVALATSLFLYTREVGGVTFPESPLTKRMGTHTSYIGNDALNVKIQCPTIPAILNVGGSERSVSDDGCVFRYDDRLSISIYEIDGTPYDILSTRFAPELYSGEISGEYSYVADANYMDVGYFNGYPAEYQCGIVEVYNINGGVQKYIYAITICLDLGYEKALMITVSTTEKDSIYKAEILLESICYTVMDISSTLGKTAKEETIVPSAVTEPSSSFHEEQVAYTVYEEEATDKAAESYLYVEVPIIKDYGTSPRIVFSYTGLEADISEVVLWDTTKTTSYTPMDISKTGLLFFAIEEGNWNGNLSLQLPLSQDFGTYHAKVMQKDEFDEQYGQNTSFQEVKESTEQAEEQ